MGFIRWPRMRGGLGLLLVVVVMEVSLRLEIVFGGLLMGLAVGRGYHSLNVPATSDLETPSSA